MQMQSIGVALVTDGSYSLTEVVSLLLWYLFRTAYLSQDCNMVGWTWWDWSLILMTLFSFSALTLLVWSFDSQKPVPDMTYNVFGGMLNLTLLLLSK